MGICVAGTRSLVAATSAEFLAQVKQHFAAWDADSDGTLTVAEIDRASADPQFKGDAAAALAALKRGSRFSKLKSPELNNDQIQQFATEKGEDKPDLTGMYSQGVSRLAKVTKRDLFARGTPQLSTIHQGRLGNCFCLAPLGAVVHTRPEAVVAMFQTQDDGRIRVTLGKNTTTVAPPTDTEIARTASNEDAGLWVNVYEKALGQLRNEAKPEGERASSPIDVLAKGGSAGTILSYITGHEITRFSFKFAKEKDLSDADRAAKLKDLREQLQTAVREKRLMTCGTLKTTVPGITGNHAYAVLGYDAKTDAVKVWNPFGNDFTPKGEPGKENGYARKEGISEIPVPVFVDQFSGMAFEVR
jgi:hypothetical protein